MQPTEFNNEPVSQSLSKSDAVLQEALTPNDSNFTIIEGERFVSIDRLETMPTFFLSMISASDHWLFTGSNGALSAGRGSPDSALFPYYTVDKILDNWNCSGPQTIVLKDGQRWDPFKKDHSGRFKTTNRICKSLNGDIILFEETNETLGLTFRFTWRSSEKYGFIRTARIVNDTQEPQTIKVIDGVSDILPASIDDRTQQAYSCLVDGYRLSELEKDSKLLVHRMAASLVDEAIPLECLTATTIWSNGWPESKIITEFSQVDAFLSGALAESPSIVRAKRGAYLNGGELSIESGGHKEWSQIANVNQSQSAVAQLHKELAEPNTIWQNLLKDVETGRYYLNQLIAASDGQQITQEAITTTHHRANALFNIMRGGVFPNGYKINVERFKKYIAHHCKNFDSDETAWLNSLPEEWTHSALVDASKDASKRLQRLSLEYLPLVFSRRHGDPSRPWNRFNIQTKDANGDLIVGFQGNWRDIFQNWEALAFSFPHYNQSFIYKFLNASTADGYNPYRITNKGIDWEEPDPNDPWASIGYWGDHQIIYLLKLLEFSENLDSDQFKSLLRNEDFVFADVPYEIKGFEALATDPNHSIHFNAERNKAIAERTEKIGADGKLVHLTDDTLQSVSLIEKLLIPLLAKLSNYIPSGGIWMNTQRPEWNDANNALAGNGLSMVTTYYIHRYVTFLESVLETETENFTCFEALNHLFIDLQKVFEGDPLATTENDSARYKMAQALGNAGEVYRNKIYKGNYGSRISLSSKEIQNFLASVRAHIQHTIEINQRPDALYHAYNILHIDIQSETASVENLGVMLEGQVAVLSSKAIAPKQALKTLKALRNSDLYCPKRNSYILYADKALPTFLQFNRIEKSDALAIPLLAHLIEKENNELIEFSSDDCLRFNRSIRNRFELDDSLNALAQKSDFKNLVEANRSSIHALYEATFNHHSFTGRSGSMFSYEGLGCIYWHMVSKLMLAIQEITLDASNTEAFKNLSSHYYDVQDGLGFRRTAAQYGAFTPDAYSHTPAHAGAQQPGLTGMVKEGLLCRFGELGVEISKQRIRFNPSLLREAELLKENTECTIIRTDGLEKTYSLLTDSLLFTLIQVPVIYKRTSNPSPVIKVYFNDETHQVIDSDTLPVELSQLILNRDSNVDYIQVEQPSERFLSDIH